MHSEIVKVSKMIQQKKYRSSYNKCYEIIAKDPSYVNAYKLGALAMVFNNNINLAVDFLHLGIDNTDSVELIEYLLEVYLVQRNYIDGMPFVEKTFASKPNSGVAYKYAGFHDLHLENFVSAIRNFSKSLQISPLDRETLTAQSTAYRIYGLPDIALKYADLAYQVDSKDINVLNNLALALKIQGHIDDAKRIWIEHQNNKWCKLYLAQYYLRTRNYPEGWNLFEGRLVIDPIRIPGKRVTKIVQIKNRDILLVAERDPGQQILMARFIPKIQSLCRSVTLVCHSEMVGLFKNLRYNVNVIPYEDCTNHNSYWLPLMSIPKLIEDFSGDYSLKHPAFFISEKKQHDKFRVGFSWNTSKLDTFDAYRSIKLEMLSIIFSLPDIEFVSLEFQDIPKTIMETNNIVDIEFGDDPVVDILNTVASCDVVIGVDNWITHLAASCHKTTCLLLNVDSDWEWTDSPQDQPWYTTLHIFQQIKEGDWQIPLLSLMHYIHELSVDQKTQDS